MIYNLGRVVPLFKGTYDAATTYTFLDVVFYDNSSFVALDTTTGNLPTDTSHWLPVALKGLTQDPTPAQMQEIKTEVEQYIVENTIVDTLTSTATDKSLSANKGRAVKQCTDTIILVGADDTMVGERIRCLGEHKYKIFLSNTTPDWSNVSYTGSQYDLFSITNLDENQENSEYLYLRGCDTKSSPLAESYTVETVKNGYLRILFRANQGETIVCKVIDITDTAELIGEGATLITKNLIPRKGELVYDGKYISSSRTSNNGIISKNYIGGNYTTYSTVNASTVKVYKIPIDAEKYAMWIPCFFGKKYDSDSGQMPAAFLIDENDKIVAFSCNMYGNGGARTGTIIPKSAKYMIVPYYTSSSYLQYIYLIPRRKTTPVGTVQYKKFKTYSESTVGLDTEFPILCGVVSNDNGTVLKQTASGSLSNHPSIYRCLSTAYSTSSVGRVAFQIAYVEGYDRAVFNSLMSNYYNYTWCIDENGYIIDYINISPSSLTVEYKIPSEVKFIAVPCYSTMYNANPVFTLIKEDKQDEAANTVYDGLGFTRNMGLTESGKSEIIVDGYCTTDFIDLSQGFNMTVNDGFKMYKCVLYYGNGEVANPYYMPFTKEFTGSGMANVGYRCYSTGCVMPGFKMRIVFGRNDTIYTTDTGLYNPIGLDEYPFKTYTNLSDRRLTKVVPQDKPYETFKNRLNALTLCQVIPVSDQWTTDNDNNSKSIPTTGTGNKYWNCRFRKGWVENAIPYSESSEYSYYVGQNVSLITYITSVLNKRSVMYTERINKGVSSGDTVYGSSITSSIGGNISAYGYTYRGLYNTYASSFYGTVCTGLTGYLLGQRNIWISGDYQKLNGSGTAPRIPNLNTLITNGGFTCRVLKTDAEPTQEQYDDIIDSLQPMDFIWNKGHCSAISDIYKDEYGHTQFICWAEQTQPTTMIRVYSREDFKDRLYHTHVNRNIGWAIMRYSGWNNADLTDYWGDTKIVPSDYYKFQKNLHIDPDITTFRGEYACFKIGDYTDSLNDYRAYLNIHRGGENGYNYLEIFNEDDDETTETPERTIPISNTTTFPSDGLYPEDAYDNEDWIIFNLNNTNHIGTRLNAGLYKARLKNTHDSENIVYSGFTHFEMLSMTLNIDDITTNSSNVSTITVNWTCSDNATAYLYRAERSTGMYQTSGDENTVDGRTGYSIVYEIDGTSGSDRKGGFTSANPYVKLFVRGTYGTQVLKKNYLGSGGDSGSGSGTPDEPEQ